jgi:hypothetical protein
MSTIIKQLVSEGNVLLARWYDAPNETKIPTDSNASLEIVALFLGPSCALFLHWAGREFNAKTWVILQDVDELAARIGLGTSRGQVASMLERLHQFRFLRVVNDVRIEVRTMVPRLTPRQAERVPAVVLDQYLARLTE